MRTRSAWIASLAVIVLTIELVTAPQPLTTGPAYGQSLLSTPTPQSSTHNLIGDMRTNPPTTPGGSAIAGSHTPSPPLSHSPTPLPATPEPAPLIAIPSFGRRAIANPAVDLQLAPVDWPVLGRKQTLAVDILVRAGSQQVTVVGAYIDFEPPKLQVVSIELISNPENPLLCFYSVFTNLLGRVDISCGVLGNTQPPGTGYFRIARVVFRPVDGAVATGSTPTITQVSFAHDLTSNRETAVIHGDYSLLRNAPSVSVTIDAGAAALTEPVPLGVATLQRGISQSFGVTARDRTNAPMTDIGYTVSGNPANAMAVSPPVGSSGPGGSAPVSATGLTTSGTGVVDVVFRSPLVPGGEVRMSRLVAFTNAVTAPTPTPQPQSITAKLSLRTGWNLIALPILPLVPMTSASLCTLIDSVGGPGTADEISRWSDGGWDSARCNVPTGFTLGSSRGYFVRVSRPVTVTITGTRIAGSISAALTSGWNLVAFPLSRSTDTATTAIVLVDTASGTAGTAMEIDRWESGAWESHVPTLPINPFLIEPGRGYFVRVAKPVTWIMQ
ncbi:MAG: hypothetical protein EBT09_01545 [Actinobacteria bacterium]|nr:hypothetical protein [Actinomycetota bacterium]